MTVLAPSRQLNNNLWRARKETAIPLRCPKDYSTSQSVAKLAFTPASSIVPNLSAFF